jgi:hypothetical protein
LFAVVVVVDVFFFFVVLCHKVQQSATKTNFEIADLRSVGAEAERIFEIMMLKWKNGIFPNKIEMCGNFRRAFGVDGVASPRHPMQSSPQQHRGRIAICQIKLSVQSSLSTENVSSGDQGIIVPRFPIRFRK